MQQKRVTPVSLEKLLRHPTAFPVKLDLEAETVTIQELSREARVRAAFHDGRKPLGPSIKHVVELKRLLSSYRDRLFVPQPVHYIFHNAFCGSTLLARYLDQLSQISVYKEPQALTHLAWYRGMHPVDGDRWRETAALMVRLISRTASSDEIPVIKLHDGCNTLAGALLKLHPESRGVILYSDLPTFLLFFLIDS